MILCSKLKKGLSKIVTKSEVFTKFNVTKSRLHCTLNNLGGKYAFKDHKSRFLKNWSKLCLNMSELVFVEIKKYDGPEIFSELMMF